MLKKSFTLLELIIVIVVIGILTAISLPNFTKAKERALSKEAAANLKLIYAAEKIYQLEVGGFYGTTDIDLINSQLRLSLNEANWDYDIGSTAVTNFSATADRMSGPYDDCVYTLTQAGGEPTSSSDCP